MFILTISEWIANLFILSISLFLIVLSCLVLALLFNKSETNPSKVVTADRIKRSEGPFFKHAYPSSKFGRHVCHSVASS